MKEVRLVADNLVFSWLIQKNDENVLCRFYANGGTLTLEQFRTLRCLYSEKELRKFWQTLVPYISAVDWTNSLFEEIKNTFGIISCNNFYDRTATPMNTIG